MADSGRGKRDNVTLGDIVTPSLFWACYPAQCRSSGDSTTAQLVRSKIDQGLLEYFSVRANCRSILAEHLEVNSQVCVNYQGSWFRGVITEKKQDGRKEVFSVMLVDVGVIVNDLDDNSIYDLPDSVRKHKIQAFLLALHGIEPLSVDVDIGASKTVLEPSQWAPYHISRIKSFIGDHEKARFRTIEKVNDVKHGILYVTKNQVEYNVNDWLVEKKFALQMDRVMDVRKYMIRNSHFNFVVSILGISPKTSKTSNQSEPSSPSKDSDPSPTTSRMQAILPTELEVADNPDQSDRNKAHTNIEDFYEPKTETRSRAPIYPAGFQAPSVKKGKTSPNPTGQRSSRPNSRSSRIDYRPNTSMSHSSQETQSDNEYSNERRRSDSHQITQKPRTKESSVPSNKQHAQEHCEEETSATKSETKVSGDLQPVSTKLKNKPKTGLISHLFSFLSSNDKDDETSSDESDIKPPAQGSDILRRYTELNKNLPLDSPQSNSSTPVSPLCPNASSSGYERKGVSANENLSTSRVSESSFNDSTTAVSSTPERSTNITTIASPPTQNTSNVSYRSVLSENSITTPQNASYASNASSGRKSRLEREKERYAESCREAALSSAGSSRRAFRDDLSDSSSQSSFSRHNQSNSYSESHCNLSVSSSRSDRRPFSDSRLTDSMSETEESSRQRSSNLFEEAPLPHKERVLAHDSFGGEIYPVSSLADFQLEPDVKNALGGLNVTSLFRLQAYACPLILDWRDVAIVHAENTGKTASYVIPLLSLLQNKISYRQHIKTNCPKVVIVCPWSSGCESAASAFKKILGKFRSDIKLKTVYSSGKNSEKEKLIAIANGVDVLITTPRYLLKLFECTLIDFKHMHHFILDGCRDLFKYFEPEVLAICEKVSAIKAVRKVQVVAVSQVYNAALDKLIHGFMKDPAVIIAYAMEAAVYGKCACRFVITSPENKVQSLLDMLENFKARELKTVIVCNTAKSVDYLHEILLKENYNSQPISGSTIVDEHIGKSGLSLLRGRFEGLQSPVIVCTDDALVPLHVVDAYILIHYDLPPIKHVFSQRYFSIFSRISNRLAKNVEPSYCKTGVIIDTESRVQFPEILDFMKRFLHKVEIPPIAEEIAKSFNLEREIEEKREQLLCPRLLKFGACWGKRCKDRRHVFINELDYPQFMPPDGYVKLHILHVLDASHFSARLLEVSKDSVTWTHCSSNYVIFAAKLNMHFLDESNCYQKEDPQVGDLVVFELPKVPNTTSNFRRALITRAYPKKPGKTQEFDIKLIDEGFNYETPVLGPTLLTCPECFAEDLPFALDVFVCGLKPVDMDHSWSRQANNYVRKAIESCKKQEGYFFIGKIMLALQSRLWLNPFECQQYLESAKTNITKFSVKQELLEDNYAVKNPEHLPNLFELCRRVDLPVPVYEMRKDELKPVKKVDKVEPQWAHLPLDEVDSSQSCIVKVYITHNDDPSMVFVQQVKFIDSLAKLHNDINIKVNADEKILGKDLNVGDFCLANFEGEGPDKWFRAQIIDKPSDGQVDVFYVDYGQEGSLDLDQTTRITPEFITRLPFQAIECALAAVRPTTSDEWDTGAALVIDEYMMDDDGVCKTILAKAISIDTKAKRTGGRRYKVVLRDILNTSHSVNKDLIDRGFAKPLRSEALTLEPWDDSLNEVEEPEEADDVDSLQGYVAGSTGSQDLQDVNEFYDNFGDRYCDNFTQDDEEDLKNFAVGFFSQTLNRDPASFVFEKSSPPPVFQSSSSSKQSNQNAIEASNEADLDIPPMPVSVAKCPLVLWHQTPSHICLQIKLMGVDDYNLEWGDNFLGFQTLWKERRTGDGPITAESEECRGELYQFSLTFCGVIDSNHVEHSAKGFYVDVKMKKRSDGSMWPRLTLETHKVPWLKFNYDYMEETEDFGEFQFREQRVQRPGLEGLDEDDSKDFSWQEKENFARYDMPEDPYDPMS